MLVLKLLKGESFVIGTGKDAVVVTVRRANPERVHLVFSAHRSVPILRAEIHERLEREKEEKEFGEGLV